MIKILKKNGEEQTFNGEKIKRAIRKSAERVCVTLSDKDEKKVVDTVKKQLQFNQTAVPVSTVHNMVEVALDSVNSDVAKSYREFRDNKAQFASMLDKVYSKKLSLNFVGDRSNANSDSALVTTQKAIVYNELNSELYKKFFLTQKEERAMSDGYIYVHDRGSRLDTINCCLFDMENLLKGGFFMGNLDYTEPKTLDVAFDLIGDVTLNAASFQYGGFTIPEVDKLLAPYAKKSYNSYFADFIRIKIGLNGYIEEGKDYWTWKTLDGLSPSTEQMIELKKYIKDADEYATNKVRREFEQGFQSWEMKFNSVASSRGDYPFTALTFGIGTGKFETMCSSIALKVRKNGQGKGKFKHPVLFPKLSFFYDENLHGEGKELEWLFDEALECSMKTMYPDFISCTGDGYAPSIYKKYGITISRMGCVNKSSIITYKQVNKSVCGPEKTVSFGEFWDDMKSLFKVKDQKDLGYFSGFYMDLSGIQILDKDTFVNCERIIKNINDNNWYNVYLDNDISLKCTSDHPWTLIDRDNVHTEDLEIGNSVTTVIDGKQETHKIVAITKLNIIEDSYDVTTESSHFVVNGIYTHNCRANLSPWYERGGMEPADENDKPIYKGRFNLGAISLNFPMMVMKAKKEDKDFFEVFEYYLDMVRGIHKRTFEFLSHKKAGINPLGFCQGGFLNGNKKPDEELGEDFLRPMTMSFGVIGLNEAQYLTNGKYIHEDNSWAKSVLEFINDYANKYKKEDGILWAIYGTPGESLVGLQVQQFKKKYGIIKGVSDRAYVTNSFHCPVYADITPIEKQDAEYPLFHLCNGGNIAYARMRSNYNFKAFKDITKRAMRMGFYWGNNQELDFCEDCSHAFIDSDVCPKCGSTHITRIERMNGYIGLASIRGRTMYSDHKLQEFKERVSM